jgi:hypothetical protein
MRTPSTPQPGARPAGRTSSELIASLAADVRSLHWYERPVVLFSLWILAAPLYYALIIQNLLHQSLQKFFAMDPSTLFFVFALLTIFLSGSVIAFSEGLPGFLKRQAYLMLPLLALLAWLVSIVIALPQFDPAITRPNLLPQAPDLFCGKYEIGISILPALAIFLLLRTLAPVRPVRTTAAFLLAAVSGSALCLEFFCPYHSIAHRIYGHWGVVVLTALIGMSVGRRILRW